MSFKVGDKVRLINNNGGAGYKEWIGSIFTISKINSYRWYQVIGNGFYYTDSNFELAFPSSPYYEVIERIKSIKARRESLGYKY